MTTQGTAFGKRWSEVRVGDTISGDHRVTAIVKNDAVNLRVSLHDHREIIVSAMGTVK